jgi:hypothetical protein
MRRSIIVAICAACTLAVFGGCYAVTLVVAAVIGALNEIAAQLSTIAIILMIPILVALALVFSAADWATCALLLWQLLKLLGWQ